MHSSRMRTGRSLTVCWSLLPGGEGACLLQRGWLSAPVGSVHSWGVSALGGRGVHSQGGVCSGGGGCLLPGGVWLGDVCSQGCLLPGVSAPRGVCSRVVCSGGCLLWGVSAPGGSALGVSAPGGSAWGVSAPGGGGWGVCFWGCLPLGVSAWGGVCSRGCLLWGACLLWGVSAPGGGGVVSQHAPRQTPPCEQNDKQVQKYYLGHNFVAAGN